MIEFFKKYWKLLIALFSVPLIITYLWFICDGIFPTGRNLDKSHWLGFTGGFLAYIGTVFLGTVTLWQNDKANEMNKELIKHNQSITNFQERAVMPILTVEHFETYPFLRESLGLTYTSFYISNKTINHAFSVEITEILYNDESIELDSSFKNIGFIASDKSICIDKVTGYKSSKIDNDYKFTIKLNLLDYMGVAYKQVISLFVSSKTIHDEEKTLKMDIKIHKEKTNEQ